MAKEEEMIKSFSIDSVESPLVNQFNIAPTSIVPAIVNRSGKRHLEAFVWGLIPTWAKERKIGYSLFNARAESLQQKPAFRSLFVRKRVVVPSSGFYEWKRDGKNKQPYLFLMKDETVFGFAGLYDIWKDP
ncbi:SOS response-associated peptidase [Paenibacillus chitinolyticus]|uniref:SOS response-associated peptidase n=1 Tax=Paenibacillus chitinolyticus TaxID=79263 RepID=UPI00295E6D22|nr:SOS response-associated peptidase [Paenibacillus chitinolyticus]